LFTAKKTLWNEHHNITVAGFDVEMYVQDASEIHASTGIYSLTDDSWVLQPNPYDPSIDRKAVRRKAEVYMDMIDNAIKSQCDTSCLDVLKESVKQMRKAGLESGGEYSVENLAFKVLRRNGYIEKLFDASRDAFDKEYSVESLCLP
jgi:hypothetical protein